MEQPINNIVVGFDFSTEATWALGTALAIGSATDADICVITSLRGHLNPALVGVDFAEVWSRDSLIERGAVLDAVEARIWDIVEAFDVPKVAVSCEVSLRGPTEALLDAAGLNDADLILVGNSRLGLFDRVFARSTEQRLMRQSRWPVMVVKPDQCWPPRRLLCPVDFSEASRRALGWAGELAHLFDAQLDVLHVVRRPALSPTDISGFFDVDDMVSRHHRLLLQAHDHLNDFCDIPDLSGVRWSPLVAPGDPELVIDQVARRRGTDLICLGSVGRDGLERLIVDDVAERMLGHLPCAMLTAKPDAFVLRT